MRTQVLIDAIVRQTTVLIARISTAEGARSPLGHIAGEVFSGLVGELENQGVSKKVIADMFGMALRSYRQKVQRLGESATSRGVTLWSAVQSFLAAHESTTRAELLERFQYDDEASVRGILNDLVESGFVVRSGRGEETRYRVATEDELKDAGAALESNEWVSSFVWLLVYREGPIDLDRLASVAPIARSRIEEAIENLVEAGRIRRETREDKECFLAEEVLIPLGETAGWEAAVVDHHRAVSNALAAKLTSGSRTSAKSDEVGGTTLTFDLWPGHPKEEEVRKLLATIRSSVLPLWDEVSAINQTHPPNASASASAYQVHFYFGQYLVEEEKER